MPSGLLKVIIVALFSDLDQSQRQSYKRGFLELV